MYKFNTAGVHLRNEASSIPTQLHPQSLLPQPTPLTLSVVTGDCNGRDLHEPFELIRRKEAVCSPRPRHVHVGLF